MMVCGALRGRIARVCAVADMLWGPFAAELADEFCGPKKGGIAGGGWSQPARASSIAPSTRSASLSRPLSKAVSPRTAVTDGSNSASAAIDDFVDGVAEEGLVLEDHLAREDVVISSTELGEG